MSKIDYEITSQRFEILLDLIGAILVDEIDNQKTITGNELFDATVWKERFIAFDKTEIPAINVFFDSENFSENTPITSRGTVKINIEVITNSKHTETNRADTEASLKCHKLLGVIRYILKNPNYLRLGLPAKNSFIFNTNISNIQMMQPIFKDGLHTTSGKLEFEVEVEELNGELDGILLELVSSIVKISDTEKGYKFEK